jgi:hypothetical protein
MLLNLLVKVLPTGLSMGQRSSPVRPRASGDPGAKHSGLETAGPPLSRGRTVLAVGVALIACALGGCVTSTGPILGDARAILGDRIQVHAFTPAKNGARDHSAGIFEWSGSRYLRRSGSAEYSDFTVHPYEGRDLIIQTRALRGGGPIQYGLARRIGDGVYLLIPINEEDADEGTRARFCTRTQDAPCRITTPEQLFVFARATAAKDEEGGGIAVVLAARRR